MIRMVASTSSACYTRCKVERDLSAMVSGKESGFQFGISRKHPESAMNSSPLKVSKDSHRIRKPPLPLPQVQYRPPIIIHTYSPKIIHTQPDDFMSLVQKLTGSSDTRLRLKKDKAPSSSKKDKQASGASSRKETSDATILERQGTIHTPSLLALSPPPLQPNCVWKSQFWCTIQFSIVLVLVAEKFLLRGDLM